MTGVPVRLLREVWGLFVDDGSLAVMLVIWTAIVGVAVGYLRIDGGFAGLLLVFGMVAILVENVRRFAARKRRASAEAAPKPD